MGRGKSRNPNEYKGRENAPHHSVPEETRVGIAQNQPKYGSLFHALPRNQSISCVTRPNRFSSFWCRCGKSESRRQDPRINTTSRFHRPDTAEPIFEHANSDLADHNGQRWLERRRRCESCCRPGTLRSRRWSRSGNGRSVHASLTSLPGSLSRKKSLAGWRRSRGGCQPLGGRVPTRFPPQSSHQVRCPRTLLDRRWLAAGECRGNAISRRHW